MEKSEALQIILSLVGQSKLNHDSNNVTAYQIVHYMMADEIQKADQIEVEMYETDLRSRREDLLEEINDINDSLGEGESKYKFNWLLHHKKKNRASSFCPF